MLTKLEELKQAKARLESKMLDFDTSDEFIDFERTDAVLDQAIAQISATPGTGSVYAAQLSRGVIGFVKDIVVATSELLYEGIKAVPKLAQSQTPNGKLLMEVDARIFAETLRLGNITAESLGQDALQLGKAVAAPVTTPWANGQKVEAVTRGTLEVATLAFSLLKGVKAVRAARAAAAAKAAEAEKLAKAAEAARAAELAKTAEGNTVNLGDGLHIKGIEKPTFSGEWKNYKTHGLKVDATETAEGRRMIEELEKQGCSRNAAISEATGYIKTGSTLPEANPMQVGDKFYKVVSEGGKVGAGSAYWTTKEEILKLKGLSYDQIADRFGLPLASQSGTRFQVMEITAFRQGTTFSSVVASTSELGANGVLWTQKGKGIQTLLPDRSLLTSPTTTTLSFP